MLHRSSEELPPAIGHGSRQARPTEAKAAEGTLDEGQIGQIQDLRARAPCPPCVILNRSQYIVLVPQSV